MGDAWDGEDRRENRTPTVEEMLHTVAYSAAQQVGQIHRRRLVVQSFIAALLAAAAVSIPVTLVSNHQRALDSTANSEYNCRSFKKIAEIFSDFIRSDADLRYQQQHYTQRAEVESAFSKIIRPKTLQAILDASDKLDTETQAYWTEQLRPRLVQLAAVNCERAIE